MAPTELQCSLIKRLSQDMLDTAFNVNGHRAAYPRCDSSDCLVCQGQRTFCSQTVTDQVCHWLERRLSGSASEAADTGSACQPSEDTLPELQPRKRLKRMASDASEDSSSLARACSVLDASQNSADTSQSSSLWSWRQEWADRPDPAPCSMVEVASLQSPAESRGLPDGRCRHDMICGLEFSLDGQLLAAAGISKQVVLYQLSDLHEQQQQKQQQQQSQQPYNQQLSCSSSSRRIRTCSCTSQQQNHNQQQEVPSLPPIAVVRLPGKVSSISWCPDMEGVLSVGDYDGTLTQIHVASGHYLSEVDAHCGRRIWSVCHSRIRPHLVATASDDGTAKIWSGRGLSTPAAVITHPGKFAVCGVDFSDSDGNILALAAADARVYLFDLRRLSEPLAVLHGHRRPVSYAKFFGPGQLVSASTDGTMATWDLSSVLGRNGSSYSSSCGTTGMGSSMSTYRSLQASPCNSGIGANSNSSNALAAIQQHQQQQAEYPASCSSSVNPSRSDSSSLQPWKVFQGHTNEKSFVGMSVLPTAGLMAVGSENGEVFTYHTSWSDPLARFTMANSSQQQRQQQQQRGLLQQQLGQPAVASWQQQEQQLSVCAVAWRPPCGGLRDSIGGFTSHSGGSDLLAASTSVGTCKLLALVDE